MENTYFNLGLKKSHGKGNPVPQTNKAKESDVYIPEDTPFYDPKKALSSGDEFKEDDEIKGKRRNLNIG